ncbi:hypothetical protein [Desulfosarcina variabilis]|uniref:hypothetical protein n=1 Tax=Desulfosarcina variabilis TaxID=2300 RepID=UPI003AFB1CCE
MTESDNKPIPDFFNDNPLDPVSLATGKVSSAKPTAPKKKVGFYLNETILDRFNRKFHQLKLDGVAIDNKSVLAELALEFALDDMDRGDTSRLMEKLSGR